MEKDIIIMAPHADDEIIGCFEILETGKVTEVILGSGLAVKEVARSASKYGFFPSRSYTLDDVLFAKDNIYLFPDPYTELHPKHRAWGHKGEALARAGFNIVFYSTNMQAPYIREVQNSMAKRVALDICYPEKSELWKFDHKYFLFEGHTKWIMKWQD